ncbi:hypothetical protein L873DRAFT_1813180 [Choiromyces venosus 120613-1]|uniref:Uncharacterized protein n=1 Tax=Choiromyces venosus 120613-1 TaxID=1336337 RepID=A0A3N4JE36_9PEZI|nr:hypothetical protein L873DRAFT_1813180 [Choiromyces venosus 120613-1]
MAIPTYPHIIHPLVTSSPSSQVLRWRQARTIYPPSKTSPTSYHTPSLPPFLPSKQAMEISPLLLPHS